MPEGPFCQLRCHIYLFLMEGLTLEVIGRLHPDRHCLNMTIPSPLCRPHHTPVFYNREHFGTHISWEKKEIHEVLVQQKFPWNICNRQYSYIALFIFLPKSRSKIRIIYLTYLSHSYQMPTLTYPPLLKV